MMIKTLLAASIGLLFAGNAMAVNNGDFSAGLTDWTSLGDVTVISGAAMLTSASVDFDDDYPDVAGAFNASGTAADTVDNIEASLDVAAKTLGDYATEGSLLKQTFNVNAGDTLSFNWNFFTNEPAVNGFADYAFVSINGVISTLATAADATFADVTYAFTTNAGSFNHVFASAGAVELGFGVLDMNDYNVTSALTLDNVTLVAAPIPEADTYALMLAGLGLVGFMARRRKSDTLNQTGV
jgi:hypothetical protein